MNNTQISSGWKFFFVGGCAVAALCGATMLAFLLMSAWITQAGEQPVGPDPQPSNTQQSFVDVPQTVGDILAGHQWRVHAGTLCTIEAYFKPDGSFEGIIIPPATDPVMKAQPVIGQWTIAGPLLYLEWDWTPYEVPFHEQIPIEITSVSVDQIQGVDEFYGLWKFERIGT